MSAGAVEVFTPEARVSSRNGRPPLRLVASDGTLCPDTCFDDGERFDSGELALAPVLPALRFTRRGRLAITLMAAIAVATMAMVLATSVDAAPPQIDHATTVSAGQTLSEVAATQLPGLPIGDAVAWIQLANGLNTSQVHAGQSLLIPVMP
jgi:hypothetical protein